MDDKFEKALNELITIHTIVLSKARVLRGMSSGQDKTNYRYINDQLEEMIKPIKRIKNRMGGFDE